MLNVTCDSFIPSVVMVNVTILTVVMLIVIMLRVVAPKRRFSQCLGVSSIKLFSLFMLFKNLLVLNRKAHIRQQRMKTTVLSCHRCLINTSIETNEQHFNINWKIDHKMSLSKSKCWYSNNCLHFLKHSVQLIQSFRVRQEPTRVKHIETPYIIGIYLLALLPDIRLT
jgi:hypothetical protein